MPHQKLFYRLLANNLFALTTTNFVWFALTFWAIIETRSVIVASFIAGIFAITNMIGAFFFGAFVDHHKRKKTAMIVSSVASLGAFALGAIMYNLSPATAFSDASSPYLWTLVFVLMCGTVAGNMRSIALSTTVSILFTKSKDKANGLVGASQGVTFALTSIGSGLVIGFSSMGTALLIAVSITALVLIDMITITYKETLTPQPTDQKGAIDIRGTIALILAIPGLFALIVFTTFNNFLGGVFMALMDIYGLSLVSVTTWGIMWSILSCSMIVASTIVARYGVGSSPLRTILIVNLISWGMCIVFPLQPSIIFLAVGMFSWLFTFPFAEAAEQTVIQEIVPLERQGRVIGFGQSLESAVSPITTFLIGPITQIFFVPFMTTGVGALTIGSWFGTGEARGIALVFICAGVLGVMATVVAWRSWSFRYLAKHHEDLRATT